MRWLMGALALGLLAVPAGADEPPTGDMGSGPHAMMRMKFEVTFMKIDVAEIEARFTDETGERIGSEVAGQRYSKDGADRIGAIAMEADPVVVTMGYLRDGDFEKFQKGVRRHLETARKADLITDAQLDEMWSTCQTDMAAIAGETVAKGSRLVYRFEGDRLLMVLLGPDGDERWKVDRSSADWVRAFKGGFFSRESRFREKLVKSLFERGEA